MNFFNVSTMAEPTSGIIDDINCFDILKVYTRLE